ncbi:MAG: hypothetical protein VX464_20740 [Pseudomonadota bacterium]|nr:hypothetical protein [Pseudomonadota bacterium]
MSDNPQQPSEGDIYHDLTDEVTWRYSDGQWRPIQWPAFYGAEPGEIIEEK